MENPSNHHGLGEKPTGGGKVTINCPRSALPFLCHKEQVSVASSLQLAQISTLAPAVELSFGTFSAFSPCLHGMFSRISWVPWGLFLWANQSCRIAGMSAADVTNMMKSHPYWIGKCAFQRKMRWADVVLLQTGPILLPTQTLHYHKGIPYFFLHEVWSPQNRYCTAMSLVFQNPPNTLWVGSWTP